MSVGTDEEGITSPLTIFTNLPLLHHHRHNPPPRQVQSPAYLAQIEPDHANLINLTFSHRLHPPARRLRRAVSHVDLVDETRDMLLCVD